MLNAKIKSFSLLKIPTSPMLMPRIALKSSGIGTTVSGVNGAYPCPDANREEA